MRKRELFWRVREKLGGVWELHVPGQEAVGARPVRLFAVGHLLAEKEGRVTTARTSSVMDTPPNNIHTIVRAQIVFLLSTLTEENFAHNQAEIRSVRPYVAGIRSQLISIII